MPTKIIKNSGRFKKGQKAWNFGKKATTEAKYNMSKARVGRKFASLSEEHRRKISEAQKGKILSVECKKKIGDSNRNPSTETRKKMSNAKKGNKASIETKLKMSLAQKGKLHKGGWKLSQETREKMRGRTGEKNPRWKGGITPKNKLLRSSVEYVLWRESVFKRDDYTCVSCGVRGCVLNAHHIKPFATYPYLRFAIDNGETLCDDCHRKEHFYKEVN